MVVVRAEGAAGLLLAKPTLLAAEGNARQISIDQTIQTAPNAISPSLVAKKKRDFDPHAFLATIGEGRKSLLFRQKQGIFAQGMPRMRCSISRRAKQNSP